MGNTKQMIDLLDVLLDKAYGADTAVETVEDENAQSWENSIGYEQHTDWVYTIRACLNGEDISEDSLDYFNDLDEEED